LSLFLLFVFVQQVNGLDDGVAVSPPMGWRSWNQFGKFINQSLLEAHFAALADRSRAVDGVPTSLLDLGYERASIDDGWALWGPNNTGYHNASGYPIVNTSRFPDMAGMTSKARSLGLKAGWYENGGFNWDTGTYGGVINSTLDFGFEGIKLDRGGGADNPLTVSSMFNASGKRILQENNNAKAHRDKAGNVVCPMHLFRTGLDIRPTFGSVLNGMRSTRTFNEEGLTGPGCWAHADMLVVGVTSPQPPGAKHHCATTHDPCSVNFTEMRTNFGAWCIISSPLILAMDLRNTEMVDLVWPIITNREAIAVNQQWFGDSGRLHSNSSISVTVPNCGSGSSCKHQQWMVWSKTVALVPGKASSVALLLVNNDDKPVNVSASLIDVHGLGACGDEGCSVRSIWERRDLPAAHEVSALLAPHDSAFFVVGSSSKPMDLLV